MMKIEAAVAFLVLVVVATAETQDETTALSTAAKMRRIRLIGGCRPALIQRDALCGCFLCRELGLSPPGFDERCMSLFNAGFGQMRNACNRYRIRLRRGTRIRSRRVIGRLRFISRRCPRAFERAGIPVTGRRLTNLQVLQNIGAILDLINDMLKHLVIGPSPAPVERVVAGNAEEKRVARLASYNNLKI